MQSSLALHAALGTRIAAIRGPASGRGTGPSAQSTPSCPALFPPYLDQADCLQALCVTP